MRHWKPQSTHGRGAAVLVAARAAAEAAEGLLARRAAERQTVADRVEQLALDEAARAGSPTRRPTGPWPLASAAGPEAGSAAAAALGGGRHCLINSPPPRAPFLAASRASPRHRPPRVTRRLASRAASRQRPPCGIRSKGSRILGKRGNIGSVWREPPQGNAFTTEQARVYKGPRVGDCTTAVVESPTPWSFVKLVLAPW